jgi:lambda repressor-like predicted transcriptional regulator
MTTNTTRQSPRQVVRDWPPWEINERLRRKGLNQLIIAQRARTSESTVSHTIRRRRTQGEAVERVWAKLQEALTEK